jgi:hypothetical protein
MPGVVFKDTGRATAQLKIGPMFGSNGSVIDGNGEEAQIDAALCHFLHRKDFVSKHTRPEPGRIAERVEKLDNLPVPHDGELPRMRFQQLRKPQLERSKIGLYLGSVLIISHGHVPLVARHQGYNFRSYLSPNLRPVCAVMHHKSI